MSKYADKTDEALDKLVRAASRLAPEQGIVARRNAREAVLKALRDVRAKLDSEYPTIRTKASKRRTKLTPGHKLTRLRKQGYVRGWYDDAEALTARRLGIRTERCPQQSDQHSGRRWYPGWLCDLVPGCTDAEIKRAHKSPKYREQLRAQKLLTAPDDS